jgi:hypothetical protein
MRGPVSLGSAPFIQFAMVAVLTAAGIAGTLAEDGGPYTKIRVDFATNGGLKPEILRASLAVDEAAMGLGAALA